MPTSKPLTTHVAETMRLAGPLAAAQLATFFMGMVDVACVGRFSEEALGAVAVGNALHWAFSCILLGIPLALDPLISQSIGKDDFKRARQWLKRGLELVVLLGIPLVLMEITASRYIEIVGIPATLAQSVHEYVKFCAPSTVFFQLFLVGRAYLQSIERTAPIVFAAILTNGINLISDIVLVFGDQALEAAGLPPIGLPSLGVVGAGMTTTISTAALSAIIWRSVRRESQARDTSPHDSEAIDTTSRIRVMSVAWPIGCQQIAESWLFCLFGVLVGRFGEVIAAGYQTALTLAAGAFMLALGLSSATSVRVGHAVGRGSKTDVVRAGLAGTLLVLLVMGSTATLFITYPLGLVSLLTDQSAVVDVAVPLLAYAAAFALFDGVQVVMAGALRGAGDVRIPFVLGFLSYWGVGGVVAWHGMTNDGVTGIWFGLTAGLMAASILLSLRWRIVSRRELGTIS
ncbi:MAG: MATE family efflux transporter [Myxococcota bacterium]|nr:MATE family efflux transporter [Myxococcota bacterium]